MNSEKNEILKSNIIIKESKLLKIIDEFYEGFYALFYLIIKSPLDNFWWECISLTIQYTQMLIFIINGTVSNIFSLIKNLVFTNLESR